MKRYYLLLFGLLCFGIIKGQYSVILNFNNPFGYFPGSTLTISGGKLFGMTLFGGGFCR